MLNFNIDESEKTKIGKIFITGNDKTYDNVIRREMMIHPGDTFNMKKIEESFRQIFMLDYFENVNPQILQVGDLQNLIDLEFEVLEKETGRANFSMGYNEVHGLTGGGGFDFVNFRGKGQMLSVSYNRGLQIKLNILLIALIVIINHFQLVLENQEYLIHVIQLVLLILIVNKVEAQVMFYNMM